jgi:hypothetical protein
MTVAPYIMNIIISLRVSTYIYLCNGFSCIIFLSTGNILLDTIGNTEAVGACVGEIRWSVGVVLCLRKYWWIYVCRYAYWNSIRYVSNVTNYLS